MSEPAAQQFSVGVPTWRRPTELTACLAGIRRQEPAPTEILVAGRREDADASRIAEAAGARYVLVDRPGHVPPIRALAEAASCDLLAIVDDDAVPRTGWAAALLAQISANVACVGGAVNVAAEPPRRLPRRPGEITWYGRLSGGLEWAAGGPRVVATVMEGNWLWRTSVLRALDFDPVFDAGDAINYGLDLTLQARRAGWTVVFTPDAAVDHTSGPRDPSVGVRDPVLRQYLAGRNRTRIILKSLRGWRRPVALAWWWGVGDRHSFGVARAAVEFVRRQPSTGRFARAAARGRLDGARAGGKSGPPYRPPQLGAH
jgi:GT2 family glycosyltransferase